MKRRKPARCHLRDLAARWGLVVFCLVIGLMTITVQYHEELRPYSSWSERLVTDLVSGHKFVAANDGPTDYRVFRSAAELVAMRGTADLYNPYRFRRFEEKMRMKAGSWYYPPTVIPVIMLSRFSDAGRGFLIWTALLTMVSLLVLRGAGIPWPVVAVTFLSPAVLWNFGLGQFGLISGAFFVASLVWVTERPAAAGIAAGLLTTKPQAGLLLPVVYIARGQFRAIAIALFTFGVLVALTLALYGAGVWAAFVHEGLATAHRILVAPFPTPGEASGISIFWMARSFGFGVALSYAVQAVGATIAIVWCWLAWRDPGAAPWPRIALTTCLATFVTPYGYNDDLCAFSLGIALLAWHRGRIRPSDVVFWVWPAFVYYSVLVVHVLITPLLILLAAISAQVEMKGDAPGRRRMETVLQDVTAPTG